ncbi:MAG TPA: DUF1491 family protein [Hyphomicrobiaceae bacterium]|nr:DUF1491 family protein [Hyphomicrobiaceae bacterium]
MRIPSELWVKAYVRQRSATGLGAFIVKRGDDRGGAIWIKVARLDGTASLYGPAMAGMIEAASERRFEARRVDQPEREIDDLLTAERRFDDDIWIVEIEDRQGRHGLGDDLIEPEIKR